MFNTIVIDSSCWIELISKKEYSSKIEGLMEKASEVFVPTLVIFEVYKSICKKMGEEMALSSVSYLSTFTILELTSEIALSAADISLKHKLPMADSIVLAHALAKNSILLTLNFDFNHIPGTFNLRKRP